ncbi:MAG: hypothetical protein GWP08_09355 [Nitrospiraceae bacterium]|nr:hypothetical protein [Nitrospiraceae bacterium]
MDSTTAQTGPAAGDDAMGASSLFHIGLGALAWTGFCVLAVVLRGVRWDENYEFAQAALRLVPYAEGHPLFRHARGLYSLQMHTTAALLALTRSPAVVCGLRNLLFLLGTVLPVYGLCAWLTRRALWGHAAALLALTGIHLGFYGVYPQYAWPGMYSNGHIGTASAVLAVGVLACGYRRAGFLLAGLMPAIHLGQAPPVLCLAGLWALWEVGAGRGRRLVPALAWGSAGLALSVALWVAQRALWAVPDPTSGPYHAALDTQAVWLHYMERFASHRNLYGGATHLLLAGLLVLGLAAALAEGNAGRRRALGTITAYAAIVAGMVWGIMAVHAMMGPRIPFLLVGWLPYRLVNHAAPLLIVVAVFLLADGRGTAVLAAALLFGLVKPLLALGVPEGVYARYLADGSSVLFFLYGAALARIYLALRSRPWYWRAWLPMTIVFLAFLHQFGAACSVLGVVSMLVLSFRERRGDTPRSMGRLAAALSVLLAVALVYGQWRERDHLPVSDFERDVASYLDAQGQPDALLVANYRQELLQAKTGHPVFSDMATITWVGYEPALGTTIAKMYGDVYGLQLAPGAEEADPVPWFERWARRSQADWQALGETYQFQYVVAPFFAKLNLPVAVAGAEATLYAIPNQEPAP